MTDKNLRALYGLKYNPFYPNLPTDALLVAPAAETFAHRIQAMISQGGFALITGDPGQGKSKTLQWIANPSSAVVKFQRNDIQ
jgi:general secretion pathway protein A